MVASEEIEAYDGSSSQGSELKQNNVSVGGRRRKQNKSQKRGGKKQRHSQRRSQKRGGKKQRRSQRRSQKRQNMHGGESEELEELENQEGLEDQEDSEHQEGGKKRYKKTKGKKTKGKKSRKGKVSNWIKHVLNFAKVHKMKYPVALKDPRCKASYKKH